MSKLLTQIEDAQIFAEASKRLGLPFPVDHFYLPLVRPSAIIETKFDEVPIIDPDELFDKQTILNFAAAISSSFKAEICKHDEVKELGLGLGYGYIEAYIYNTICRAYKPDTILEIGSGVSTWYAREATQSASTEITCVEPFPGKNLTTWCAENNVDLRIAPLQSCYKLIHFGKRPILFVDSTHVTRVGGELHLIFLELIPRLPPGALIHFHDIFLPFACLHAGHNSFFPTTNWYESTLLAIFLHDRKNYEVVLPQYYMYRTNEYRPILASAIPAYAETGYGGSSFWVRKVN